MKRFLSLPLILLLCAGAAFAQNPTFINSGTMNHAGAATTVSFTSLNALFTTGNSAIAFGYCSTAATLTIADVNTGGTPQTWVPVPLTGNVSATPASGTWGMWIAYSTNATPTADTITVTSTTSCPDLNGAATESAHLTASGFDKGPASGSGLTSASVTPSNNIELVVGLLVGGNGGTTPTAGSGYTILAAGNTGGTNPGWEAKVVTTCGSQTASFVAATGTVQSNILTFKGTASSPCAASPVVPRRR